ncbi:hypothetical protein DXG03_008231 [Asterophora parasitica]|uniref:Uncharacterized protein n=1 Tax=Asterophora parasitica TaxID=117018 RepID=A0A9P7K930_9AGAR|nr:hypothetical protein DXG03_008231 [Asterophora parasitica]
MDDIESLELDSRQEEKAVNEIRCAAIALSIEEEREITELPELDDEAMDEAISEDAATIARVLAASLPAPNANEGPANPFNSASLDPSTIDLSELIKLRRAHQTLQAASGIRTAYRSEHSEKRKALTERQMLLRRFEDVIKEQRTALKRRENVYLKFGLPKEVQGARVSAVGLLGIANGTIGLGYVFVLVEKSIMLAQGELIQVNFDRLQFLRFYPFYLTLLSIYAKAAGKAGKHAWVSHTSNIAAVSYLPVQLFENMLGSQFRAIHTGQKLHVKRFHLSPSSAFLSVVDVAPTTTENGGLKVSQQDWQFFCQLKARIDGIVKAVKLLNRRKKSGDDDGSDEDV